MPTLTQALSAVSNALLLPVAIGLLALLAWSLAACGGFARELIERRRTARARARVFPWLAAPPDADALDAFWEGRALTGLLAAFAARGRALRDRPLEARKLLDELEVDTAARLASLAFGSRAGPMLGLMGTLIPLGPALLGLSTGDLDALARGLVLAFATTVVGLACGLLCQALLHVRRGWYARDLSHLDWVCERLEAEAEA